MTQHTRRRTRPASPVQRDVRRAIAVLALGAVLIGMISLGESMFRKPFASDGSRPEYGSRDYPVDDVAHPLPMRQPPMRRHDTVHRSPAALNQPAEDAVGDEPSATDAGCKIDKRDLRIGDSGTAVTCLQHALVAIGYLTGTASGTFDNPTFSAVNKLQKDKDMFVDGVVGRETALSLNIWPDEASLVIHTPPPAPGAVDLLGYPLSYVATSGPDAPPLPANSGQRQARRVRPRRSASVGGRQEQSSHPLVAGLGQQVQQRSARQARGVQPLGGLDGMERQGTLPHMIRYTKTKIGAIGFHGIPRHVSDGSRYEKDSELGTRLSGGCTRQADLDADFMWDFAQIGTKVVVT